MVPSALFTVTRRRGDLHAERALMADAPLVSIIIPTYNRCEKLREAVDSALAQEGADTTFETEVIVVDDGSTDATPRVVPGWPGLRYLRLEQHKNVSAARNAGIAISRGDYIAFL